MRLSTTVVSLICVFSASTQAIALPHAEAALVQRDEFSDLAARDYDASDELERRQFFDIAKLAFQGGKALGHLIANRIHRHHKRALLDPHEERVHLLQLRDKLNQLEHRQRQLYAHEGHEDGGNGAFPDFLADKVTSYLNHQKREVDGLLELNARQLRERDVSVDLGELD